MGKFQERILVRGNYLAKSQYGCIKVLLVVETVHRVGHEFEFNCTVQILDLPSNRNKNNNAYLIENSED